MFRKILAGGLSVVLAVSAMSFTPFAQEKQLAFPGAEGGGMYSQGARASSNFTVYHVTNLYDSGTGSFRDAVSQGNRIIVFDVAGNIMLESSLQIRSSNLTILGQTAPGEGICVGGNDVRFSNANNVIMRYMRFRMGDISDSQEDGLGVRNCTEVILDHCSVSWSIDECLSAYENKNFTAQYCIISESLNQSHHAKGDHGYGGIWGGTNASFHHNLIATHNSRTPRVGSSATVHSYQDRPDYESLVDIRNNVIYNWGNQCAYGGERNTRINLVNNYYKPTAIANPDAKFLFDTYSADLTEEIGGTIYANGNIMEGDEAMTNNNRIGVVAHRDSIVWKWCESISDGYTDEEGKLWANDQYIYDYPVNTTDANTAYNDVLEKAGASHYRDQIDTRVINDVRNGTMPTGSKSVEGLIDSQNDVGGWVSLYGQKPEDKDNDGMADQWEKDNGLDISKNDSTDIADNGYTNIENYGEYILETEYEGYGVDSSLLKAEIDIARALVETDYSREDWQELQGRLSMAELAYFKSAPTQEEIDTAYDNLRKVVDSLVVDHSDMLRSAIQRAKAVDRNRYSKESLAVLDEAVAKGEADLEAGNSDNYQTDTEAIDAAIEGLSDGYKARIKKVIDFIKTLDLSNLTIASRNKLNERLQDVERVYNDINATESEADEAYNAACGIFREKYDIVKKGRALLKYDFENGYNDDLRLADSMDHSVDAVVTVQKGYKENNTNVATTDRTDLYGEDYFDRYDTEHFRISCDIALGGDKGYILGFVNHDENNYYIEKSETGWEIKSGSNSFKLDGDFDGIISTGDWSNFVVEINKPEKQTIFYINNIPIYKGSFDKDANGFKFVFNNNTYVDNVIFSDLTAADEYIVGDCDFNGIVDTADVSHLLSCVLSGESTVMEQNVGKKAMEYTDLDCSGILDSADVAQLLQKVLDSTYKTPADIEFGPTIEATTEETTEETTETTTLDPNTIYYPVEGGEIHIDRTNGTVTGFRGNITNVIIPSEAEGVTVSAISPIAFRYSRTIESIYIPSTIKTIAEGTFQNLGLRTVTIENGVETIERRAFQSTAIGEITIPSSVRTIGDYAFMGCMNLRNVVIEEGVKEIGRDAFGMCGFDSILIPDSVTSIGRWSNFGATILCHEGSYAQQYAIDNNYKYEIIQ